MVPALRSAARRVARAWAALNPEQRLASVAAVALLLTMFLPWYEQKSVGVVRGRLVEAADNLAAFNVFSFVEAAILLVALGVLALMFLRGERRGFHLPGGDGTVIFAAGLWAAFLFFFRLFDRPAGSGNGRLTITVGIQWGFFIAFVGSGFLAYAGARLRAAHRPEPPLPVPSEPPPTEATRRAPVSARRRRPPGPPRDDEPPFPGQLSFDEAETGRADPREPR